ncbi:MAG: hypothetical protein HOV68_29515 [Streptomycetaceae bacterium]|nr:hypothetical protein [Streptomycetaceae bacterium]
MPYSGTAAVGSPHPIFDKLMEEWQRMFRAVPGDRYGEGFGAAANAYNSGGYVGGYAVAPMPVPAFRPEQAYPQAYGNSGGYPQPATGMHTPPPMHTQAHTPPPMHTQRGGFDPYAHPRPNGRSELALMPVAGYQAQQMPL